MLIMAQSTIAKQCVVVDRLVYYMVLCELHKIMHIWFPALWPHTIREGLSAFMSKRSSTWNWGSEKDHILATIAPHIGSPFGVTHPRRQSFDDTSKVLNVKFWHQTMRPLWLSSWLFSCRWPYIVKVPYHLRACWVSAKWVLCCQGTMDGRIYDDKIWC